MTHWVMARQMPDGSWLGNGLNRPPLEYSVISHTAMAAGGLIAYPIPGRQREMADSLSRAKQWLLAADPKSAEERGMRLMGLVWTGAPRPRIAEAIKAIRASTGSGRRVVAVLADGTGCVRDRPVVVRLARRRRAGDRSGVPQRRRVPARQPVPGRCVARENPLVPRAAVLRERVPVRPASVDFGRRHELGLARDRADLTGYDAITITNVERRDRGDRRDYLL